MIYISNREKIKKILLEHSISNHEVMDQLNEELMFGEEGFSYEITFIGFQSIPAKLFKSLYRLKDKLKITTTHRSLSVYLSRMGIKNVYIDNIRDTKKTKPLPKAVAIGGSAGSIERIIPIVESLPYIDISVFVVVHVLAQEKSNLSKILQRVTDYKVFEAKHGMKVEKNSIYVAVPNNHLVVADGFIYLESQTKVNYSRPSIDVTFKSLAYEYKESLLAILLCGYGSDGSESLKELKELGSEIIIENPSECAAKDMPLNAIKTKNYSKILSLEQIIYSIKSLLRVPVCIDDNIDSFLEDIFVIYGYDFRRYDRGSLKRRIELTMKQNSIENFHDFRVLTFDDESLFAKLLRSFSINVTTFFRDPEVFSQIRDKIIPGFERLESIKIWCAGCSKGNEPYSVAILLDEAGLLDKSQIYATDFNETILNEAKNGLFAKSELDEFKQNYKDSGGKEEAERWFDIQDDFIEIKEKVKDRVLFFKHNLATDSSINEFDLILCRNVLIYFDNKLQKHVFDTLDNSLGKNSFLILGDSEVMPKDYKYKHCTNKIYTRKIYDC